MARGTMLDNGRRYYADKFDADGKFYVFDEANAGSEACGPFDTLTEAGEIADDLNIGDELS